MGPVKRPGLHNHLIRVRMARGSARSRRFLVPLDRRAGRDWGWDGGPSPTRSALSPRETSTPQAGALTHGWVPGVRPWSWMVWGDS